MTHSKIRLEQIEEGRTLRRLVQWFRLTMPPFAARLDDLRARSRRAAARAHISPKHIDRLIANVRSQRAKT